MDGKCKKCSEPVFTSMVYVGKGWMIPNTVLQSCKMCGDCLVDYLLDKNDDL